MAVIEADFEKRLSGGASNSDGDAALGGVKSTNAASTSIDALFDATAAQEAVDGSVEYRCIYLHNGNGSDEMTNAVVYMSANTPLGTTTIDIGVGSAAINAAEQTVANETTAPSAVSFSAPTTAGAGLALGDIPAGQHKAIWLRRTISAGSGSSANDTYTLGFQAETA